MRVALQSRARRLLRVLADSPAARHAPGRLRQLARRSLLGTDRAEVLRVAAVLDAAGVEYLVGGGWGVDLLIGRQTRRHDDLDIVVADDDATTRRARAALTAAGYEVIDERADGGPLMPRAVVMRDSAGHLVDLLPVSETFAGARGSLDGREIPCVAEQEQVRLHAGYEQRQVDVHDIALLRAGRQESAVVIAVPEAERVVGRWRSRLDRSARDGMPAHITVLYPFLPPSELDDDVVARLTEVTARAAAFEYQLTAVGRFPGSIHLVPEPREPFVALTEEIAALWPECPPYGGGHTDIRPHLTVADGLIARVAPVWTLARALPIAAQATELWLMAQDGSQRWTVRHRLALGGPGT